MNILYFLVQQTMFFAIPLIIAAIGAMFCEKSGVVNIAIEGIMIMGAFAGVMFLYFMQDTISGQPLMIAAILVAGLIGGVFSLLHAFAAIRMKAEQTISGVALNMFAPALAIFVARLVRGAQQIDFRDTFHIKSIPLLGDIPVIGELFFQHTYITTYIGIAIAILAAFILKKTRFGLRLKACGEHPQAAESVGVKVERIRYAGVLISGVLAGIAGFAFVVPTSTNFAGSVAGYGFLSIAVLIFGQWDAKRIVGAAFLFAVLKTIASVYSGIPVLKDLAIPNDIYKMLPYVVTLIILAKYTKKSHAPKAAGIPYNKGDGR